MTDLTNIKPMPREVLSFIEKGMVIVDDVPKSDFRAEDLEFIQFWIRPEPTVNSVSMRERAVELKGNFGLKDAQRILDYLNYVKAEDLQNRYIILPGTVVRDWEGNLEVPQIIWYGKWTLSFRSMANGFADQDRFARCKQQGTEIDI